VQVRRNQFLNLLLLKREFAPVDEQYEEQNGEETWPPDQKQQTPLIFKLTALIVLAAFAAFALGNLLHVFTLPSLDFLIESRRLRQDPLVQELQQAVVQVQIATRGKINREQRGTGFNIRSDGLIVTNRHLVKDAASITVLFPGRRAYQAVYWSSSSAADLAIIGLKGQNLPVVALEESLPVIGEKVIIIGNPLNFIKVVMRGEVTNYWQVDELPEPLLEINAPIQRGSSGSPVFNEKGRVVAVIFATVEGRNKEETRGLALPAALLQDLLE
jgi:S1-C subfamily serine protease